MNNYKSKILQLLNSNAIVNDDIYKDIYNNIIDNIKTDNSLLESSIISKYDEIQIFYINHSDIFIMCYQGDKNDFLILNEDELMCDISKNIDKNIFTIEKKHNIISSIINNKKRENIKHFIPESKTIQSVIDIFNTIFYNNKDLCKLVLIIIGELLEKKNINNNFYFVNLHFKNLLTYIFDYGYSYFKTDNINLENFKTKYYNYNLNKCLVLPCNKYKSFYNDIIKNNVVEIILVSIYYKNRYKSSHTFIENNLNNELKEIVTYFRTKTINKIIETFQQEFLENSTCLKITHSELHYLWKEYCIQKNIPNVVSFNQLKEFYSKDEDLFKTSNKLEYVSDFVEFWNNNIYSDNDETKFEVSEIQHLLKIKKGININEKKIISLISHFHEIEIENDKYINNINCKCFKKKEILNKFKKSKYYNFKFTKNNLYKKYIEWVNDTLTNNIDIVISKNYFVEYI